MFAVGVNSKFSIALKHVGKLILMFGENFARFYHMWQFFPFFCFKTFPLQWRWMKRRAILIWVWYGTMQSHYWLNVGLWDFHFHTTFVRELENEKAARESERVKCAACCCYSMFTATQPHIPLFLFATFLNSIRCFSFLRRRQNKVTFSQFASQFHSDQIKFKNFIRKRVSNHFILHVKFTKVFSCC